MGGGGGGGLIQLYIHVRWWIKCRKHYHGSSTPVHNAAAILCVCSCVFSFINSWRRPKPSCHNSTKIDLHVGRRHSFITVEPRWAWWNLPWLPCTCSLSKHAFSVHTLTHICVHTRHSHTSFHPLRNRPQLVDLPCVIESYKTLDGKTLYKTGDISQMLVCATDVGQLDLPSTDGESLDEMTAMKRKELSKKFIWSHGCKTRTLDCVWTHARTVL